MHPRQREATATVYGALRISFDINAIISHFYIFVNRELYISDILRKHVRHMLTSPLRHMRAVGHTLGIEGVEGGIVVEIERLDALATADLDKS